MPNNVSTEEKVVAFRLPPALASKLDQVSPFGSKSRLVQPILELYVKLLSKTVTRKDYIGKVQSDGITQDDLISLLEKLKGGEKYGSATRPATIDNSNVSE